MRRVTAARDLDLMQLAGDYLPSPNDVVAEQVRQYEQSGGTLGNTAQGVPCVILTTVGARSGGLRKTALMRVEHDGSYAVIASRLGKPVNPNWYHNLLSNPRCTLQDGSAVHDLLARSVEGPEKTTWWQRAVAVWPDYDKYQAATTRVIPVMVLEAP